MNERGAPLIIKIDIRNRDKAEDVLSIQLPAYQVEAEIIGSSDIPPLKDTVSTLQDCGETFYGYYENNELCGVISLKADDVEVDIHRLIVHPKHFRKGIAQLLLNFIESKFKVEKIKVATGTKNAPALNFYKKNEYHVIIVIPINNQLSITYFEKNL